MKRRFALAAAVIAALTAGATYAATALTRTAAATNVVQACVKVPNGDVRIVDGATQCHRDERSMTWSVQGPKGDKGDKGETGATGAAGLSVQTSALAAGDGNCPFGGSSFTVGLLLPTSRATARRARTARTVRTAPTERTERTARPSRRSTV